MHTREAVLQVRPEWVGKGSDAHRIEVRSEWVGGKARRGREGGARGQMHTGEAIIEVRSEWVGARGQMHTGTELGVRCTQERL